MSDPAVAAAERALDNLFDRGQVARALNKQVKSGALEGACEALAPLRELHYAEDFIDWDSGDEVPLCNECEKAWPCATARLIYTTEELNDEQ